MEALEETILSIYVHDLFKIQLKCVSFWKINSQHPSNYNGAKLNFVEMCMHLVQTFMLLLICWILFSNFICFDLDAYEHVALEAFNSQHLEDQKTIVMNFLNLVFTTSWTNHSQLNWTLFWKLDGLMSNQKSNNHYWAIVPTFENDFQRLFNTIHSYVNFHKLPCTKFKFFVNGSIIGKNTSLHPKSWT
jgi:hypothetical protein